MNGSAAKRAWDFVDGFSVPPMGQGDRERWGRLIETMSEEQFIEGVSKSRTVRPPEQVHLRPSVEAFRAYAIQPTESKRPRNYPGCAQCSPGGWVRMDERTVRPCAACKPEQYNAWRTGVFRAHPALTHFDPVPEKETVDAQF